MLRARRLKIDELGTLLSDYTHNDTLILNLVSVLAIHLSSNRIRRELFFLSKNPIEIF